jgi:hypothetical protein
VIRLARCVCGQLSLRCAGDPLKVSLCHCLDYQKRTGSTYGVAAFFRRDDVEPQGVTWSYTRPSDGGTPGTFHFCSSGGSTVFWKPHRKPELVSVAVGSFADPKFPAPTQALYTQPPPMGRISRLIATAHSDVSGQRGETWPVIVDCFAGTRDGLRPRSASQQR